MTCHAGISIKQLTQTVYCFGHYNLLLEQKTPINNKLLHLLRWFVLMLVSVVKTRPKSLGIIVYVEGEKGEETLCDAY